MTVRRFHSATLRLDAKRTPQGFLCADARIARTGVQVYRKADGTELREYRPAEEVFNPEALASFGLAPVTLQHPSEAVTADNARQYAVGMLTSAPKADGKYVSAPMVITDAKAIKAVESGEAAQVSCGYMCDLDPTPGTSPEGEKYDAVQRNIRGNHVALVPQGRAGPEVRVRLDANDAVQVDDPEPPNHEGKVQTMEKIVIDGVTYEVTAQVKQALERKFGNDSAAIARHLDEIAAAKKETATVRADADKLKARADAAEEAAKKAEQAKKDAEDPAKVSARVAARVALEKSATRLAPDLKADGLDDAALRKAVIAKLNPELKLDDKSEAYIIARFDLALEQEEARHPMADAHRVAAKPPAAKGSKEDERNEDEMPKTAEEAQAAMKKHHQNAWKPAAAK